MYPDYKLLMALSKFVQSEIALVDKILTACSFII